LEIPAAGEIGLVTRALDGAAMQPVGLVKQRLESCWTVRVISKVSGVTVSSSTRPIA
jgi:hypothetical protein